MTGMTATAIGKSVGKVALAAAAAFGAIKGGRALSAVVEQSAQPAISAPAAVTSADIAALREHIDEGFRGVNARADGFNGRLSTIEGYMKAQQDAALQQALVRRLNVR